MFGGEIVSMEQYTHQDPQPMNKTKMHNVLEHNKLEEDQMLILLLLLPPQRRPPQQHVAATALRQASHTTMSLNWQSSLSSSSVLLLLPLLLLVLSATAIIAPCSSFVDPVHICCSRLDPTYMNLQLGKVQVGGGCGFFFSLVEFAVNERCFLKGFAFLLFQVQSASCVAAGRTLVVLLVVGLEFITEGDFVGRVPVALAVVRIWN